MRITNAGRGIHQREIVGVEQLQKLPSDWYAFTNLDLALSRGKSREIDAIIVAEDRIFLVDLKDWHGRIESRSGRWRLNNRDMGPSPVRKIHQIAKDIAILLRGHIQKHVKGEKKTPPLIQGVVVITAPDADTSGIASTEIGSVATINEFIKTVTSRKSREAAYGEVFDTFIRNPLTSADWRHLFSRFFNTQNGAFKPGKRNYGGYIATSDLAVFEHRAKIYAEYDAIDANTTSTLGTIRLWDFTHAETKFQNEEGRAEITGREKEVISYLCDRSEECEVALLQTKAEDLERGVTYWEVYDRRRRLKRLQDFIVEETVEVTKDDKIELSRQILAKASSLHRLNVSHLDFGSHSVWLQLPSTVRFSHLMAASYPQFQSLGETRYQFLSSSLLPEDVLGGQSNPIRKDVFLLGGIVHQLLFGVPPRHKGDPSESMPPEWSPEVDSNSEFAEFHPWFEKALSLEPTSRFENALEALDDFNQRHETKPSKKDVLDGLGKFQSKFKSQMQLFAEFPPVEVFRDDPERAIWKSSRGDQHVFIKMWKRTCWEDQLREAPRILEFLERADAIRTMQPPYCPKIQEVIWLVDAIVLVEDWVPAPNLQDLIANTPSSLSEIDVACEFLMALIQQINSLHDAGLAHGDLKPANVLVSLESGLKEPIFVDLLDFTSASDGEKFTRAYAPQTGGKFERDRFAITKIVEDLYELVDFGDDQLERLSVAISECRETPPGNATLWPLNECLEKILRPPAVEERLKLSLSIRGAAIGPVVSDEGSFYLRRSPSRNSLFIRGATEEIEIVFGSGFVVDFGRRLKRDQKFISRVSRFEFLELQMDLEVNSSGFDDFTDLHTLTQYPGFHEKWEAAKVSGKDSQQTDEGEQKEETTGDFANDELAETTEAQLELPPSAVDIAKLWQRLIDYERDLSTEGVAKSDSSFQRDIDRHLVSFELEQGTFEYRRDDRVLVERLGRRGRWQRIGHLDIGRSKLDAVVIDVSRMFSHSRSSGPLVMAEQRLRFTSHLEETSLKRRGDAISRILSRQSQVPGLIDAFDPKSGATPTFEDVQVDPGQLAKRYGLNETQAGALSELVKIRPLGLLQGPPGTGKTKFIAALVHYALSKGLVRNVLLASQSHEAVNNAAETVLQLFSENKVQPSILRVGHESIVSERLYPYHSDAVEQLYKDRFYASIKDRLRLGGRALKISEEIIDDIIFMETAIRPVVEALAQEQKHDEPSQQKISSLFSTIYSQIENLGIEANVLKDVPGEDILDVITETIIEHHKQTAPVNPDRIGKLRSLAVLARDFIGSVSTPQRSFETFLAGTRQIVAGTCVGLGRSSLGLTSTPFDLVVVDEAARCTASELSVPIQAGRWIVLVGDQAQLEPQHKPAVVSQVAAETSTSTREVLRSDFERVFVMPYGKTGGKQLTKQYRMLPPIGRIVSSCFYDFPLLHGRTKPEINIDVIPEELNKPLSWIETDCLGAMGHQKPMPNAKSLRNPSEADIISNLLQGWSEKADFVEWLATQTKYEHPIGVICTYAAQRELLNKKLQIANLSSQFMSSIKIDTVDSYQGKENLIVVVSLVRNNTDGRQQNGAATIRPGFMARSNRINVAMSRAMDRLVIVGAKNRWANGSPMALVARAFSEEERKENARTIRGAELQRGNVPPKVRKSKKKSNKKEKKN